MFQEYIYLIVICIIFIRLTTLIAPALYAKLCRKAIPLKIYKALEIFYDFSYTYTSSSKQTNFILFSAA